MSKVRFIAIGALVGAWFAACGDSDETPPPAALDGGPIVDGSTSRPDGTVTQQDGSSPLDAGKDVAVVDAPTDSVVPVDAPSDSPVLVDASDAQVDAADDASDAQADAADADPNVDAGPIDCADASAPVLASGSGFTGSSVYSSDAKLVAAGSIIGDGARRFWLQDPHGNGISGDRVQDISSSGVISDYPNANAAFCTSSQIGRDSSGNAYVFSTQSNVIYKTTQAGVTTSFSSVGNIGGGGNCSDTGVIGLLVRADNSFFLGSPANGKIYTLTADGVTRGELADVAQPLRLDHDGADGVYATSGTKIMHVSSGGVVTERLDATPLGVMALRRDANGDVYFSSGSRIYRSKQGSSFQEVAACFPGNVMDMVFDMPTSGSGTSLYVLSYGSDGNAHDSGDQIIELQR